MAAGGGGCRQWSSFYSWDSCSKDAPMAVHAWAIYPAGVVRESQRDHQCSPFLGGCHSPACQKIRAIETQQPVALNPEETWGLPDRRLTSRLKSGGTCLTLSTKPGGPAASASLTVWFVMFSEKAWPGDENRSITSLFYRFMLFVYGWTLFSFQDKALTLVLPGLELSM